MQKSHNPPKEVQDQPSCHPSNTCAGTSSRQWWRPDRTCHRCTQV